MATEKRLKRTISNYFWANTLIIVSTVFPFIIRTLILKVWGLEFLGIGSLFTSVLNILSIGELGIGSALVYYMYKPMAEGNVNELRKLVSLYKRLYFLIGLLMLVLGVVMIPFLPKLVKGEYPNTVNIYYVYLVQLSQMIIGYMLFPEAQAVFQSDQKSSINMRNATIAWAVTYFLQCVAIVLFRNYHFYVIFLPLGVIIVGCLNGLFLKRRYGNCCGEKYDSKHYSADFKKKFITQVIAMSLAKMRTTLRNTIDTVIISVMMGLATVAIFQNYMLVISVPSMLVGAITTSVLPSLGNGVAMEKPESNLEVVKLTMFIQFWITTVFGVLLLVVLNPFMIVWAGENSVFPFSTVILLIIYFYVCMMPQIIDMVKNSCGVWKEGCWISIVESLANIVLSIVLASFWNVDGVLLASIITVLLINLPFESFYIFKVYFKKKARYFIGEFCYQILVSFIAISVGFYLTSLIKGESIWIIIIKLLVAFLTTNVVIILFVSRTKNFKGLVSIVKQMLKLGGHHSNS